MQTLLVTLPTQSLIFSLAEGTLPALLRTATQTNDMLSENGLSVAFNAAVVSGTSMTITYTAETPASSSNAYAGYEFVFLIGAVGVNISKLVPLRNSVLLCTASTSLTATLTVPSGYDGVSIPICTGNLCSNAGSAFASSNTSVVSVSSYGLVTPQAIGQATIAASYSGLTGACRVRVTA